MKNTKNISDGRLNKFHYLYLMSRFIVLVDDAEKLELIPKGIG